MFRFTIIFLLIGFTGNAQAYLGNTKEEIFSRAKEDYKKFEITYESVNEDSALVKINHSYETLYFYLVNDICVKFVVSKPYKCNCLATDIMAYNSNLISIGKFKWASKDLKKTYEMTLGKREYTVTIVLNDDETVKESALTLSY